MASSGAKARLAAPLAASILVIVAIALLMVMTIAFFMIMAVALLVVVSVIGRMSGRSRLAAGDPRKRRGERRRFRQGPPGMSLTARWAGEGRDGCRLHEIRSILQE